VLALHCYTLIAVLLFYVLVSDKTPSLSFLFPNFFDPYHPFPLKIKQSFSPVPKTFEEFGEKKKIILGKF